MKKLNRLIRYIFVAINLIVVIAMIFSAYSCRLSPREVLFVSYWGMLFPFFCGAAIFFILFWLVFHRWFMLISIVGMAICGEAIRTFCPINLPSTPPDGSIKVLSYNVMGFARESTVPWEDNVIMDYIVRSQADIVCLQEGNNASMDVLHTIFDSIYPYIVVDALKPTLNAVLLSKYPVISSERVDYESASNGSYAHRLLIDGDTVLVVNNHLESYKLGNKDKDDYKTIIRHPKDEENEERYESLVSKLQAANYIRAAQADSIVGFIERSGCRYVICAGDFNAPSLSYTHYRLTRQLNDAYTRSGNGVGFSYNKSGMYFRIDNILVSDNIRAYGARVDAYCDMSDHYPIYAWLKFDK